MENKIRIDAACCINTLFYYLNKTNKLKETNLWQLEQEIILTNC